MKSDQIKRAISIRQPYVELILRRRKTREYRSRPTNIRERVYLYASLRPAEWQWEKVRERPGELPVGVIVGTVEIVDCRWDGRAQNYAYILRHPKRLRRHLRPKGQPTPCFWRPRFR